MTTLTEQITQLSNSIEDIYGVQYSEQYKYAMNNIQNLTNTETTHIIVDIIDLTINDDHKQKQINSLKKDIKDLKEENKQKDIKINKLENEIVILKEDNKQLKEDNKQLKEDNKQLKEEIGELIQDKHRFNALVKLHDCNSLVNEEFKRLYRLKFKLKRFDNNVPNIGDFIRDPPTINDGEDYNFWMEFNLKYPHSDDENFRIIYRQIAGDRTNAGAHVNINKMSKKEFDELIKIVYPEEYNKNRKLYEDYRDWVFMFPA